MPEALLPGPMWLVGCGNMAGAMLDGWMLAGVDPRNLTVIRPSGAEVGHGVRVFTTYPDVPAPAIVMLGMKPYQIDAVAPVLAPLLRPETILVSLLAGIEAASLLARFPASRTIVKALPNTPVRIAKGVTNLYSDSDDVAAKAVVTGLMASLGHAEWFEDEALFQAAGMLSGSGPAFLYRFIDALVAAGVDGGLPPAQAARLAKLMVEGAGALAAASDETPEVLARRVASPNGTTEAGLRVLDSDLALEALVRATLEAARARSREMAAEARLKA